jgi:para-nitrobenzyl esterase
MPIPCKASRPLARLVICGAAIAAGSLATTSAAIHPPARAHAPARYGAMSPRSAQGEGPSRNQLGKPTGVAGQTVKVQTGLLAGAAPVNGVTAFLGIPYAAPPVGDRRWKPPQPPAKWDGVRRADTFGTSCMQNQAGSRLPWTEEFMTQGPIGEDCLFLNVWTAARNPNARLPVMFWIYGGGFNEGSSSVAVYDGAALARKGVVVVTVNYRVGPLGFLTHPELTRESEHHSSGNYGILDQIAALQWVRDNIAAFGGDPNQVTIFGQSAGAISVASLMRSPLAKGLFIRAIAQSGPGLLGRNALGGNSTLSEREAAGLKYAESRGAKTLAELRALPAASFFTPSGGRGGAAAPGGVVRDGWVLTENEPARQVPLMVGFVADDIGVGGSGPGSAARPDAAAYRTEAARLYGDQASAFLKLYPVAGDAEVAAAQKSAARDRIRVSMDLWAEQQAAKSKRIYTYYFDRVIPWPAHPEFGAFHTSEVPYVFNTIGRIDRPWEPVDRSVAELMSSYWVNFARKGDPNGSGLPRWPAYEAGAHMTMQLGEHSGAMPVADGEKMQFLLAQLKK